MKLKTKIYSVKKQTEAKDYYSYKTTIPKKIIDLLNLNNESYLIWDFVEDQIIIRIMYE